MLKKILFIIFLIGLNNNALKAGFTDVPTDHEKSELWRNLKITTCVGAGSFIGYNYLSYIGEDTTLFYGLLKVSIAASSIYMCYTGSRLAYHAPAPADEKDWNKEKWQAGSFVAAGALPWIAMTGIFQVLYSTSSHLWASGTQALGKAKNPTR